MIRLILSGAALKPLCGQVKTHGKSHQTLKHWIKDNGVLKSLS
jgi:hypothetical protein